MVNYVSRLLKNFPFCALVANIFSSGSSGLVFNRRQRWLASCFYSVIAKKSIHLTSQGETGP
jgi:hypothetical protein